MMPRSQALEEEELIKRTPPIGLFEQTYLLLLQNGMKLQVWPRVYRPSHYKPHTPYMSGGRPIVATD
jgi:hypothetical protein